MRPRPHSPSRSTSPRRCSRPYSCSSSAASCKRYSRTLLVFDAAGLAVFCTTGTVTALTAGMNPIAAILLGVTTGVGGGLMRDVVANRDPQLFNPNDLYAVPAFIGAVLIAGLWYVGWYGPIALYAVTALVFAFRVLSLRFRWRIPHARGPWFHPRP
ncbi:trimeric intracellular cation channel family protein [Microbacterium elymi]|uniref:trimeric intracellular cation channel family protein n=1 Tax=Microbacterium elymi TaxID=2909587 RepID=UPI00338FF494